MRKKESRIHLSVWSFHKPYDRNHRDYVVHCKKGGYFTGGRTVPVFFKRDTIKVAVFSYYIQPDGIFDCSWKNIVSIIFDANCTPLLDAPNHKEEYLDL